MAPKKKPENRQSVDESEKPLRREDGTIMPGGPSLNPGGKPAWVIAVRASLEGIVSRKGVRLLEQVIGGEAVDMKLEGETIQMTPELSDRLRALDLALQYSLAKPKQQVELSGDPERPLEVVNLSKLSDVEVFALRETLRKLKTGA